MRHSRIKEIFYEATRLCGKAREEFLLSSCTGDASVRHEIESLLAYHDAAATPSEPEAAQDGPVEDGPAQGKRGAEGGRRARSRAEKHP